MTTVRLALANIPVAREPEESVELAVAAINEAGERGADVICFGECYVPGYRWPGKTYPAPDAAFLERAWSTVRESAASSSVAVVLGTERPSGRGLMISCLVIHNDGSLAGWQDKTQMDPSEDTIYVPGEGRQIFQTGRLTFGVAMCHEGWRYPETVRWAARRGAKVVFHPHAHIAEPGSYRPSTFLDPANTFHEKAMLCRAAENTCYFASVNCASEGSGTTSAIIRPDGSVLCHQPYGVSGLLISDIDLDEATCLLANRCRDSADC